jgi:hypothetical protein
MKGMKRRCYNDGGVVSGTKYRNKLDAAIDQRTAPSAQPAVAAPTPTPAAAPIAAGAPRQAGESLSDYEGRRNREYQEMTTPKPTAAPAPKRWWEFKKGGKVPGRGNTDTVPAMLTPGEFVVTKAAVKNVGTKKLHAMNKAAKGMKRRSK